MCSELLFFLGLSFEVFLFLGTFAKLQKATISFVMSVCLPFCMECLGSDWMHFHDS
jgi:hypothetical protein